MWYVGFLSRELITSWLGYGSASSWWVCGSIASTSQEHFTSQSLARRKTAGVEVPCGVWWLPSCDLKAAWLGFGSARQWRGPLRAINTTGHLYLILFLSIDVKLPTAHR